VVLCGGKIMAASAYSDDHGDTWRLGQLIEGTVNSGAPNENKATALSDGTLLLHSRATPRRLAATSTDGGHRWGPLEAVTDLPDPSDNGSLTRFDGLPSLSGFADPATDPWLLATNNQDTSLRRNTVLSLSVDDGATWPAKLVLCAGSSAYSTATRLPDGNIGVLYERQGYREIVFASLDPGQLTDQLPPAAQAGAADDAAAHGTAAHDGGLPPAVPGLTFDMELRSITPGLPAVWQNAGEFHVMPGDAGEWAAASWKEIGQGYSPEQAQVLGTREAQDLNYGPIIPGYKEGDILAFTGRARNDGGTTLRAVRLHGPGAAAFPAAELRPGQEALYFTPAYTVTAGDVEQPFFAVDFTVEYEADGRRHSASRSFRFHAATGEVTIQAN
ncbi:MAG: exo-alpha-sialidase, partial [Actinomycetes bacterium]